MDREGGMCMITHIDNMAGHLENRRRIELPVYDPHKKNLPKRSAYIGAFRWLEAVWTIPNSFTIDENTWYTP